MTRHDHRLSLWAFTAMVFALGVGVPAQSRPAGSREFVADGVRVIVDEHAARIRLHAKIVG